MKAFQGVLDSLNSVNQLELAAGTILSSTVPKEFKIVFINKIAAALELQGRFKDSAIFYSQIGKLDPSINIWPRVGHLYFDAGEVEDADIAAQYSGMFTGKEDFEATSILLARMSKKDVGTEELTLDRITQDANQVQGIPLPPFLWELYSLAPREKKSKILNLLEKYYPTSMEYFLLKAEKGFQFWGFPWPQERSVPEFPQAVKVFQLGAFAQQKNMQELMNRIPKELPNPEIIFENGLYKVILTLDESGEALLRARGFSFIQRK